MMAAFFWVSLLFFLILGLLNGARGVLESRIRRRLRREGVETKGVVIGHWVMGAAYYVTYRYRYQDHDYQQEEQVGSSRYEAWPSGTVIRVRYLPQNPFVARIASEKNHFLATALILAASVIVMIVVAFLLS